MWHHIEPLATVGDAVLLCTTFKLLYERSRSAPPASSALMSSTSRPSVANTPYALTYVNTSRPLAAKTLQVLTYINTSRSLAAKTGQVLTYVNTFHPSTANTPLLSPAVVSQTDTTDKRLRTSHRAIEPGQARPRHVTGHKKTPRHGRSAVCESKPISGCRIRRFVVLRCPGTALRG